MRRLGIAGRLLFGIALLGVLFPVYGPLTDHHFHERLPGHAHLYISGTGEHTHPYQYSHAHGYGDLAEGALSLPSGDEHAGSMTNLLGASAILPSLLALFAVSRATTGSGPRMRWRFDGWSSTPDTPPPRAI
jgi:hypothetical protein